MLQYAKAFNVDLNKTNALCKRSFMSGRHAANKTKVQITRSRRRGSDEVSFVKLTATGSTATIRELNINISTAPSSIVPIAWILFKPYMVYPTNYRKKELSNKGKTQKNCTVATPKAGFEHAPYALTLQAHLSAKIK